MFAMFRQFFAMFSMLFSAGERTASALNHLASAGDHHANAFHQTARIQSEKKLAELSAELNNTLAQIEDAALERDSKRHPK